MKLPTRQEINIHNDLDGLEACEHFLGQTVEDAVGLFEAGGSYYVEDLMWMGPVAFRFYLPAAIQFLESDAGAGGCDFVSGLAAALEFRLEYEPAELTPITGLLVPLCEYVVANWARFEGGSERHYDDVPGRYAALRSALLRLPTGAA